MKIQIAAARDMDAVYALRVEVFVDEQGVAPEIELDEHDAHARHIFAEENGVVIGCARVLEEGTEVHIGRLAVKKSWRNRGVGTKIMRFIMDEGESRGCTRIWFHAQLHALPFYRALGFFAVGDTFFEAGIEHIRMERIYVRARLSALAQSDFREFSLKLLPTLPRERMLGVKTPALKALARQMIKSGESDAFLQDLPHPTFEENQLHAFILGCMRDADAAREQLCRFLPYVDTWSTCDQLIIPVLDRDPARLLPMIEAWLTSEHAYTVRYAIVTLMRLFSDERFEARYLGMVADVRHEDYYVRMAVAWYFATALAKQYDAAYPYIAEGRLSLWVHNKAIQKARESRRVCDAHARELQALVRRART